MPGIPVWWNLYKTLSEPAENIGIDQVAYALNYSETHLMLGLLNYEPYTEDSFVLWQTAMDLFDESPLESVMLDVGKQMNLDCSIAHNIFNSYIMYFFFGKLNELGRMVESEGYRADLLDKLWHFYTMERIFLLKSQRIVIERAIDFGHPHYSAYKKFTDKRSLHEIKTCLMREYEYLTNELTNDNVAHCGETKRWVDRNNSEVIEVLLALIEVCRGIEFTPEEVVAMVLMFNENDFGRRAMRFYSSVQMSNQADLEAILLLEYGVILVMVEGYWTSASWFRQFKAFEKMLTFEVTRDHHVIVLIWSLLILTMPTDLVGPEYYASYLDTYFTDQPFNALVQMLGLPILKDSNIKVYLTRALSPLMHVIGTFSEVTHVLVPRALSCLQLLASMMEMKKMCIECFNPAKDLYLLLVIASEMFPFDFVPFTECTLAILRHDILNEHVMTLLLNIEIYAETINKIYKYPLILWTEEKVVDGLKIPIGALVNTVQLSDSMSLLQFSGTFSYTYFDVFEKYLLDTIAECRDSKPIRRPSVYEKRSIVGIKLMTKLLETEPTLLQVDWFQNCVKHVNTLFFILIRMNDPNYELIDVMFTMCIHATNSVNCSIPALVVNETLYECFIKHMILHEQQKSTFNTFGFFKEVWKLTIEKGMDPYRAQLPGLCYFFLKLFPNHLLWNFPSDLDKVKLANDLLEYILTFIQTEHNTKIGRSIRIFLVNIMYDYAPFIYSLLVYSTLPNQYVEQQLSREPFWDTGRTRDFAKVASRGLRIIIWMLDNKGHEEIKGTKFWELILRHSDHNTCVARCICGYISNRIDRELPKLACIFLQRISMNPNIDVLVWLQMDYYQIRSFFLERIRNPFTDFDVKIGILQMIITCIKTQTGMTGAFFNYSSGRESDDTSVDTGLHAYFVEVFLLIRDRPHTYEYPIQACFLAILHTLWTEKKTFLIRNLIEHNYFWETLATPLLTCVDYDTITYVRVLDIMAMELSKNAGNQQLVNLLWKVFSRNSVFIKTYPKRIMKQLAEDESDGLMLLGLWEKLLVFVVKYNNTVVSHMVRIALIESTITGMKHFISKAEIFLRYCQLFVHLYSIWYETVHPAEDAFAEIADFITYISEHHYKYFGIECKEAVVGIAIRAVEHFEVVIENNACSVQRFLQAMMTIIEAEYDLVHVLKQSEVVVAADYTTWILLTKFTSKFISNKRRFKWMYYSQMLSKTANIVGHLSSHEVLMPFAQISMQFMIRYIKSPIYKDFMSLDIRGMYDTIKFPRHLFDCSPLRFLDADVHRYKEFWLTYTSLMNLNLTIIERFCNVSLFYMIEFLDMNKREIFQIFKLPLVTRDVCALKCVENTMRMCTFMLRWQVSIYSFDEPLIPRYYKVISACLRACVTILLKPNIMRESSDGNIFENLCCFERLPAEFLAEITERLTDILGASCFALLDISPKLLGIFANGDYTAAKHWGFDYEFHVPFIMTPSRDGCRWTFGQVLQAAHQICIDVAKKCYETPEYRDWCSLVHYNRKKRDRKYASFEFYQRFYVPQKK